MSRHPGADGYSIAETSKLTGVSCHALRVWERRYGFPVPVRRASGHRRYTEEQVRAIDHISKLGHSGRPIASLILEYQAEQPARPEVHDLTKVAKEEGWATLVDLLGRGEMASADALVDRLAGRGSRLDLFENHIETALLEVARFRFRGEWGTFRERSANTYLMSLVARMLDEARRINRHARGNVIVGTVQGDQHEGDVLAICLSLELAGWRATPVGWDLSVKEYQDAIEAWRPDALVIPFTLTGNINKRFQELSEIQHVPVFVVGRSILNHKGTARRLGLIPLVGTMMSNAFDLIAEVESRKGRNVSVLESAR